MRAPPVHGQHHMVVLLRRGMVVVELAQHRARNQHPPRHAEVDQQRLARGEVGEDVLRPPPQRPHPLRRSAARPCRSGRGQRRSGRLTCGPRDHLPAITGIEPAADGFDLGQFGHFGAFRVSGPIASGIAWRARRGRHLRQIEGLSLAAGRYIPRQTDQDATHDRRRRRPPISAFRPWPKADKAGMVHGVFTRVASQIRRDERPDVGRHPPAVEGRDDGLAGAAPGPAPAGCGGRHRRCGLPFPEARAGGDGDGAGHDRIDADRGPQAGRGRQAGRPAGLGRGRRDGAALRRTTASTSTRSPSASGT